MAVAVKHTPETTSRGLMSRLPGASLLGVVYILICLAVVFWALPSLWRTGVSPWLVPAAGEFISVALLGLVAVAAAVGLAVFGARLAGAQAPPGLRAGIFFGLVGVLLAGLLTKWASLWVEHGTFDGHLFGGMGRTGGMIVTAVVGLVLLALLGRLFLRPGFQQWLVRVEEQGWFSATTYKRSQGMRVRRWTIVGILALTGSGIFLMVQGNRLAGVGDWQVPIPFTGMTRVQEANDARALLQERYGEEAGAGLTLDRYEFRDVNEQLRSDYRKIAWPGVGFHFEEGQVVSRKEFDTAVGQQEQRIAALVDEAKKMEDQGNVLRAQDLRSRANALRGQLPVSAEPEPAAGKTTFAMLPLLPSVQFALPLLLAALSIWLAWRVVNLPPFADFLIATEAEMNKVSWTTRRRLVQDTIVVLTAVVLMTIFLLVADLVWSTGLRWIEVLRFGTGRGDDPATDTQPKQRPW